MSLFDIGVNLADKRFNKDRTLVVKRAIEAGVTHQLITCTTLSSSEQAISLCRNLGTQFPRALYSTVGVHPHHADDVTPDMLKQLHQLALTPCVKAIGEMGLDFNRNFSTPSNQRSVFEKQLELAIEIQKPVFLHQRDAHRDFFDILKSYRSELSGGVVHCFTDSEAALQDYLSLDMHIGITGWVCDERRGTPLANIVHRIPLNRLLIETDAPYLTPRTLKPKPKSGRNEPAFLPEVVKTLAQCYQMPSETIAQASFNNAMQLFAIDS
ncbi:TatD family hydrolase [Marinibactrum halimedae]|uniref:TatD-related deoxyribonuclease n=1 Tax=Marinibactrum halimedae TaxID=1444977 RepID=A0AA37TAT7_9GAMM|nr:TatD family hydrolase [Marinibactrum halimedae]MCD9458502.1 TatD family hydrolase [Marinibactrum halimedae]GLS26635.1 TatD-related deoxyribonuclease [Marinibactrum halimedae]